MSINGEVVAPLPDLMLEPLVRGALLEDLGRAGDLTTDAIVPAGARGQARLVARQGGVLAGLDLARLAFRLLDPDIVFEARLRDAIAHGAQAFWICPLVSESELIDLKAAEQA